VQYSAGVRPEEDVKDFKSAKATLKSLKSHLDDKLIP